MRVLKDILRESLEYYQDIERKINKKLFSLPQGSVKKRLIAGNKYYYLQKRVDGKVVHEYIGKEKPQDLMVQIKERKALKAEAKKVKAALKILVRKRIR